MAFIVSVTVVGMVIFFAVALGLLCAWLRKRRDRYAGFQGKERWPLSVQQLRPFSALSGLLTVSSLPFSAKQWQVLTEANASVPYSKPILMTKRGGIGDNQVWGLPKK